MQRLFNHWYKFGLLLLVATSLSACGFQLRGQTNLSVKTLQVDGLEGTRFQRYLVRYLEVNGVKVVQENGEAKLIIKNEGRQRNIVTFSATGRAREVEIVYSVLFSLKDLKGDFVIADTTLTQNRDMTYDDDQILGKEAEENRLYQEMERDIARQILTQVGTRLSANN